jgi:GT2 family glycosyltransferase
VVVLSGAALLVRRSVFMMLGGFDPNIFLFYEDDDFCYRVRAAGHRLRYVPTAIANHLRGKSSVQTLANVQRTRFHQAWSRVYVCRKHGKRSNVAVLLPTYILKYAVSAVGGNPFRRARYASSVLGTWTALRGETALAREGLLDAGRLANAQSPQR